jgi:hypothetical protein
MIQFDNRGSKVEGKQKQIATALSKLFQVPASQISFGGVTGQSTLFNHQVSAPPPAATVAGVVCGGPAGAPMCVAVVARVTRVTRHSAHWCSVQRHARHTR